MTTIYRRVIFFFLLLFFSPPLLWRWVGGEAWGQNISVNTTGAANSTLSMLEILQISATADTKGLHVAHSGAVTTGSGIGYGIYVTKTRASTTNVGGYFSASGATNNYAGIFAAGNVGIGTTNPDEKLVINGSIRISGDAAVAAGTYINWKRGTDDWNPARIVTTWEGATWKGVLSFMTNNGTTISDITTKMTILSSGNVGIGQTNPAAKLEVDGSSGSTIKIVDGNQGANKVLTSDAGGQGKWQSLNSIGGACTPQAVSNGYWNAVTWLGCATNCAGLVEGGNSDWQIGRAHV